MDYIDSFCRYLRALAALYIRMTFRAVDVYELLEPLLKDYRKLRLRNMCRHLDDTLESCLEFLFLFFVAGYSLVFMDEFVYELLSEERVCDIIMPRLIKRQVLEENGDIGPRKSRLLAAMEGESDKDSGSQDESERSRSRSSRSSPSRSQRSVSRSRSRTPSEAGSRYVSRSPSRSPSRSASRSRSNSVSRMDIDGHS